MRRWWRVHVLAKSHGICRWYLVSSCRRRKRISTFLFEKVSLPALDALTRKSRWTHSCTLGLYSLLCVSLVVRVLFFFLFCFFWMKALSTQVMVKMICWPWLFVYQTAQTCRLLWTWSLNISHRQTGMTGIHADSSCLSNEYWNS